MNMRDIRYRLIYYVKKINYQEEIKYVFISDS